MAAMWCSGADRCIMSWSGPLQPSPHIRQAHPPIHRRSTHYTSSGHRTLPSTNVGHLAACLTSVTPVLSRACTPGVLCMHTLKELRHRGTGCSGAPAGRQQHLLGRQVLLGVAWGL